MPPWTTANLSTGNITLHYHRSGGSKPPLIMLHGLTASGACWAPLARLLENDFDIIMPDARGHGQSDAPPQGYGYDDLADDVISLIGALGLQKPLVMGHSMGGMTAAVVASRLGTALGGAVLVDPTFLSPEYQQEVYASDVAGQHAQMLRQSPADILAALRARHPRRASEMVELLAAARLQTRQQAFAVLTPPNPDFRELVRQMLAPVLLIIGGEGGVVSREAAEELQGLNARLHIEQIRKAGHGMHYDYPERVAAAVQAFFQHRST